MFCEWCSAVVVGTGPLVSISLPLRIASVANARFNRWDTARSAKAHRTIARAKVADALRRVRGITADDRVAVRLTRIAPSKLDDDNLSSGFKSTRDGVADALGIDDGSARVRWTYAQERGGVKVYAARVEVWIGAPSMPCPE